MSSPWQGTSEKGNLDMCSEARILCSFYCRGTYCILNRRKWSFGCCNCWSWYLGTHDGLGMLRYAESYLDRVDVEFPCALVNCPLKITTVCICMCRLWMLNIRVRLALSLSQKLVIGWEEISHPCLMNPRDCSGKKDQTVSSHPMLY